MTRGLRLAFGLCLRDMAVDWRMSVCFVLGLTAVLAPLMVMFGLKTGLVDGLRSRLLSDPRNLEVIVVGSQQFDAAWFEEIGRRPDVAFVLPKTRAIAATMTISVPRASGLRNATVADMIPTDPGDPLLLDVTVRRAPPGMLTMIASTRLADRLKIEAGDQVTGTVQRRREGRQEAAEVALFVGAVAPAELTTREAVYVPLELMEATETFRDGYGVPALGWDGPARPGPRVYHAGVRLYARDLAGVVTLDRYLTDKGLTIRSKSADVDGLNAFADSLTGGFLIIAVFSVIGFAVSLTASLWANYERKRQVISFLRLLGMRSAAILAFPLYQAVVIAVFGFLGALAAFFAAGVMIDLVFADIAASVDTEICVLRWTDGAIFFLATIGVSVLASTVSAYGVSRISPAEGLRER